MHHFVVLLSCMDRPGIVHEVTGVLLDLNANIVDADQHSTDAANGTFFMRIAVMCDASVSLTDLKKAMGELAVSLDATIDCYDLNAPLHCALLVSKEDHCLQELLYQWQSNGLHIHVDSIISNHNDYQSLAEWVRVPFHYISAESKYESEQAIMRLTESTDMLIMARYMQILSQEFLQQYTRPVVNIHHSFLPSFKGAKPYHQAFARGVKLIGATAHYATENLDEGPIIAQKVVPVSHKDTVDDLKLKGQQIEKECLVQAIRNIAAHKVVVMDQKTVVF